LSRRKSRAGRGERSGRTFSPSRRKSFFLGTLPERAIPPAPSGSPVSRSPSRLWADEPSLAISTKGSVSSSLTSLIRSFPPPLFSFAAVSSPTPADLALLSSLRRSALVSDREFSRPGVPPGTRLAAQYHGRCQSG